MPQSARILTSACLKPAVSLEDSQRKYGRVTRSTSPQTSKYTGPPVRCRDLGSLSEADQATGAVSPTLLALHSWHQMARPLVELRSPQESQPAQHRVHLASGAAALGWPCHKDGRRTHAKKKVFFSAVQEGKRDHGAPKKGYKNQLKRQLAQAGN